VTETPTETAHDRHLGPTTVVAAVPTGGESIYRTVQSYTESAEQLTDFLVRQGMPSAVASIRHEHVEAFIEDPQRRFKTSTVGVRFRSLQQLFK
jgi:hypothetical protein